MIKTIAALTLAVTPLFIGATSEEAKASMCFSEGPITACVESVAFTPSGYDVVVVRGLGMNEKINIQCRGGRVSDWNSYGNMKEDQVDYFATEFCSGRGTTGM